MFQRSIHKKLFDLSFFHIPMLGKIYSIFFPFSKGYISKVRSKWYIVFSHHCIDDIEINTFPSINIYLTPHEFCGNNFLLFKKFIVHFFVLSFFTRQQQNFKVKNYFHPDNFRIIFYGQSHICFSS